MRPKVKAYANGWYTVERTPDEFAKAARKVVERGYKAAKLDPFGAGFYELEREERMKSIALVEAVRHAVGPDFDIFVEMHGRFNPVTADPDREGPRAVPSRLARRARAAGKSRSAEKGCRGRRYAHRNRRAHPLALGVP